METFISDLSKKEFPISEKVSAKTIRHSVLDLIQKDYPGFRHEDCLSHSELNYYRGKLITSYLSKEVEKLTEIEKTVVHSLTHNETLTNKIDSEEGKKKTIGEKIADKVAAFGGSWTFIISFLVFICVWISMNVFWYMNKGFDPYPFILLNLLLSCIAALQAPVIMMSQNRQEDKDRERAKKDYMINLKSELEIRTLHEKIDHFIMDQQREIIEIQKVQTGMLTELLKKTENSSTR